MIGLRIVNWFEDIEMCWWSLTQDLISTTMTFPEMILSGMYSELGYMDVAFSSVSTPAPQKHQQFLVDTQSMGANINIETTM